MVCEIAFFKQIAAQNTVQSVEFVQPKWSELVFTSNCIYDSGQRSSICVVNRLIPNGMSLARNWHDWLNAYRFSIPTHTHAGKHLSTYHRRHAALKSYLETNGAQQQRRSSQLRQSINDIHYSADSIDS